MKFDFTKIPGIDAELAATLNADDAAQSAVAEQASAQAEEGVKERIADAVQKRTDVAVADLKAKADKFEAKRKALEAELKAAQDALAAKPDVEPEELEALAKLKEETPELRAQVEKLREEREERDKTIAERMKEIEEQRADLANERRDRTLRDAISDYNREHPTTALRPDMEDLAMMLGRDRVRFDEDAKSYRVYGKDGTLVTTDEGAATPVDYVAMLRKERASMFHEPEGAGAPGSKAPAPTGDKTMKRSEFDAITDPGQKAAAAKTHAIVD